MQEVYKYIDEKNKELKFLNKKLEIMHEGFRIINGMQTYNLVRIINDLENLKRKIEKLMGEDI